jgi:hypothetical protein
MLSVILLSDISAYFEQNSWKRDTQHNDTQHNIVNMTLSIMTLDAEHYLK